MNLEDGDICTFANDPTYYKVTKRHAGEDGIAAFQITPMDAKEAQVEIAERKRLSERCGKEGRQ